MREVTSGQEFESETGHGTDLESSLNELYVTAGSHQIQSEAGKPSSEHSNFVFDLVTRRDLAH